MPALSPQARRRLDACLHGQEITDLAHDIAEALESMLADTRSTAPVVGEAERAVIRAALRGEK